MDLTFLSTLFAQDRPQVNLFWHRLCGQAISITIVKRKMRTFLIFSRALVRFEFVCLFRRGKELDDLTDIHLNPPTYQL